MDPVSEGRYWLAVAGLGKLGATGAELADLGSCLAGLDPGVLYERIVASRVYTAAERSLAEVGWPARMRCWRGCGGSRRTRPNAARSPGRPCSPSCAPRPGSGPG